MVLRRQVIRPTASSPSTVQRQQRSQKLRTRLESERAALVRWQTRLKRAFTSVTKHQKRIANIERQLARLEEL